MARNGKTVAVRVLPNEPTDGTGRVCIHLFVQDKTGPFVESHVLHPAVDGNGNPIGRKLVFRPTRGRLACDPKRNATPITYKGVTHVTMRTDDPRAVTCAKCIGSSEWKEKMARLDQLTGTAPAQETTQT